MSSRPSLSDASDRPPHRGQRGWWVSACVAVLILAFALRFAGQDWGIIHFHADDLPDGVRGTVYTFFPDELGFAACFRSLGGSYAAFAAERMPGGVHRDASSAVALLSGFLSGRITFAPEYPSAISPVSSYLVFAGTIPYVGLKYVLGMYLALDSNTVMVEALRFGRFLSALFGVLSIVVIFKILQELTTSSLAQRGGAAMAALLPVSIVVGHYCNYNSTVTFFELVALLGMLRFLSVDPSPRRLHGSAVFTGLALATKVTAVFLFPLLILAVLLQSSWPWRRRFQTTLFGLSIAGSTYLLLISYSLVTRWSDWVKAVHVYGQNATGEIGPPSVSSAIIAWNFVSNTVPFCLSPVGAVLAMAGFIILVFAALRSRSHLLVAVFLAIWLSMTVIHPNSSAFRLLTPSLLAVIGIAVLLERLCLRGRPFRLLAAVLLTACLINQSVDAWLIQRFFRAEDIRETSSRWVEEHVPRGSRIGLFYDMVYFYDPVVLFTDYFWRRDRHYRYHTSLDLASGSFPVDFIVTTQSELIQHNAREAARVDEIFRAAGFRKAAEFEPNLSIGCYRKPYESALIFAYNLFVSRMLIYERIPGGVPSAFPGADTSAEQESIRRDAVTETRSISR